MSPRPSGRTHPCNRADALIRIAHARAFLDTAHLVASDDDDLATHNVATALAVLAGIAASDAVCCAALGLRSRGQDHHQACDLLAQVEPDGRRLANDLSRLLDLKDGSHYGTVYVTQSKAVAAMRQARRLVAAGEALLR